MTRQARIDAVGFDLADFELEPVPSCDLCASTVSIQIARGDRYGIPVCTRLCPECGLVYFDPRLSKDSYSLFYERYYRPLVTAHSGRPASPEALESKQRSYARSLADGILGRALRRRGRGGRLLDIGGSTGAVSEHFARHYRFEALCVDPSPTEIERARARGLEAVCAPIEDYDPGDRRFDLVLLCQTIDHLRSPATTLARIRSWIADDGLLFVDPLDFRAVIRSRGRLFAALKIDHPYYLTRETMDLYLARAGFAPVALDASRNFDHIDYVCRPAVPQDLEPDPRFACSLFDEIRRLHAARHVGAPRASEADKGGWRWLARLRRKAAR